MPKRKLTQFELEVEAGEHDRTILALADGYRLAASILSACRRCGKMIESGRLDAAKVSATKSLFKLGEQAHTLIAKPTTTHD